MDWAFRMSIEEHSVPREDWVGMLEDAGKFLAGSSELGVLGSDWEEGEWEEH